MGGLRLGTDGALRDAAPSAVASPVLPGAHTWAEGHREVPALAGHPVPLLDPPVARSALGWSIAGDGVQDALDDRGRDIVAG